MKNATSATRKNSGNRAKHQAKAGAPCPRRVVVKQRGRPAAAESLAPVIRIPDFSSLTNLLPGLVITSKSLDLPANIQFDDWKRLAAVFREWRLADETIQWFVADWLAGGSRNFCEREEDGRFKETPMLARFNAIADQLGYASSTIKSWCSIALSVPKEIRRSPAKLSFTHHIPVAVLTDPKDQEKFLSEAEEKNWSVADLREAVRKHLADTNTEPDLPNIGTPLILNFTTQIERELQKMETAKPIETWPRAQRDAIKQDLAAHIQKVTRIYDRL